MPAAEDLNNLVTPAIIGGGAGLWGGLLAALMRSTSPRQTFLAVLGGMGFGAFLPPIIMTYWSLNWGLAGGLGFLAGLSIFGLLAGIQKISGRFGDDPEAFLRRVKSFQLPLPTKEEKTDEKKEGEEIK